MKRDVVIIGGGPAGSASAMFLLRDGITPLIIEQETFPRYHIGESMTGAGGKVLRDLDLADEMYRRKHPTKQGVKVEQLPIALGEVGGFNTAEQRLQGLAKADAKIAAFVKSADEGK